MNQFSVFDPFRNVILHS